MTRTDALKLLAVADSGSVESCKRITWTQHSEQAREACHERTITDGKRTSLAAGLENPAFRQSVNHNNCLGVVQGSAHQSSELGRGARREQGSGGGRAGLGSIRIVIIHSCTNPSLSGPYSPAQAQLSARPRHGRPSQLGARAVERASTSREAGRGSGASSPAREAKGRQAREGLPSRPPFSTEPGLRTADSCGGARTGAAGR